MLSNEVVVEPHLVDEGVHIEAARSASGHGVESPGSGSGSERPPRFIGRAWWLPSLALAVAAGLGLVGTGLAGRREPMEVGSGGWWLAAGVSHLLLLGIFVFLSAGLVERVDYFWRGRAPTLPWQLPMFNEVAVAQRAIEAAFALDWPRDRLHVQVLDDSTDAKGRLVVDEVCARMRAEGVD